MCLSLRRIFILFSYVHDIFGILPETVKLFKVTFQHEQRKQVDSNLGMVEISSHILLGLGKQNFPFEV